MMEQKSDCGSGCRRFESDHSPQHFSGMAGPYRGVNPRRWGARVTIRVTGDNKSLAIDASVSVLLLLRVRIRSSWVQHRADLPGDNGPSEIWPASILR